MNDGSSRRGACLCDRFVFVTIAYKPGIGFCCHNHECKEPVLGLSFSVEERTVRMKKFRLLLIHLAGRMNRKLCDGTATVRQPGSDRPDAASVGGV